MIGWLFALPVPLLIGLAPNWCFIVAANVFLGASQGLAWSMTVVMKIDLVGPAHGVGSRSASTNRPATSASLSQPSRPASRGTVAPRTVVWVGALVIAAVGLFPRSSCATPARTSRSSKATEPDGARARCAAGAPSTASRDPVLRACSQAGLVNNLNDALAWGLAPLYLAAHGASVRQIAIVAAAYPVVWGVGQLLTGWLSDHTGRKPLIAAGMLVQAGRARPARRRRRNGMVVRPTECSSTCI